MRYTCEEVRRHHYTKWETRRQDQMLRMWARWIRRRRKEICGPQAHPWKKGR